MAFFNFLGSLTYWLLLLRFSTLLSICLGTTLASPEGEPLYGSAGRKPYSLERGSSKFLCPLSLTLCFVPVARCGCHSNWLTTRSRLSAFRYRVGPRVVVLTCSVFLTRLRSCLSSLGVDDSRFLGHSFRRGGRPLLWNVESLVNSFKLRVIGAATRTGPISTRPLVIGSVWHTLWGRRPRVRILLVLLSSVFGVWDLARIYLAR